MAANISHTDVICLDGNELQVVPSCPHGPCLMFERLKSNGEEKQFFACSAFRDRKACNFFKWADSVKKPKDETFKQNIQSYETHESQRKRFCAFKQLSVMDRQVCCSCGVLLLPGEADMHEGQGHSLTKKVKLKALKHPTHLFTPQEDNKTFAQYLFAENTVQFIICALSSKFSHCLCIGTPRIHEQIQSMKEANGNLNSFLLDLDKRYGQVYAPTQFAHYNMFNNHFFEEKGQNRLVEFLHSANGSCVFLVDPPFGGMVEPLASSLSKLSKLCLKRDEDSGNSGLQSDKNSCAVPFLLFFPYFMEKRVVTSMEAVMLDYKVEYDNHDLYKNNTKKKGSPVRIFVHKSLTSLQLPPEDGYWWCDSCQRYSSSENWHCKICDTCTSKDGTRYVHCDVCERCVKPSYKHCFTCNLCQVQDHVCHTSISTSGCYICGEPDHKKRDCPQKNEKKRPLKRTEEGRHCHYSKKRKF